MTTLASTSAAAIRLTAGCAAAAVATTSPSTTAAFFTSTPAARAFGAESPRCHVEAAAPGLLDGPQEGARRKNRRRRIVAGGDEEEAVRRGTVTAAVELRFDSVGTPFLLDSADPAALGTSPSSPDTLSSPTPPSARSTAFGAPSRRLRTRDGLQATAGFLRDRSAALSSHARPFSTARTLSKPALDTHGDARLPPHFSYTDSRTTSSSQPQLHPPDLSATREASQHVASNATLADTAAPAPLSTSANSVKTLDKPAQPSKPPPRPPSPYGEINELVRHPVLYDPILKPRFPIVLCHGEHIDQLSVCQLLTGPLPGLYGFDVRGPGFFRLHYWGDLLKILRGKIGAEVFVTAVPGCVKKRS